MAEASVYVRHPNGFVAHVSKEIAEVYLRKNKGYRIVSKPPEINISKILKPSEGEK